MSGLLLRSLQNGLDPNSTAKTGVPIIQYCMSQGMVRPVEYILANGGRTNFAVVHNGQRMSLLLYAIQLDFLYNSRYFSLLTQYECSVFHTEKKLVIIINNLNSIQQLMQRTTKFEHLSYSLHKLLELFKTISNLSLIALQVSSFTLFLGKKYQFLCNETQELINSIFEVIIYSGVDITVQLACLPVCPKYLALACR